MTTPPADDMGTTPFRSLSADLAICDLPKLEQYQEGGPRITLLRDDGVARVVVFHFRAGQQLPEHQTSSRIYVQVLRGMLTFRTAGASTNAPAGSLLALEANVAHSVVALTDCTMLLTLTPSPLRHSLPEMQP